MTKLSLQEMKNLSEDEQKVLFKRLTTLRSTAKNANYASQYQAGPARIALTAGIDLKSATNLHTAYWKMNKGWKEVALHQKVKTVNGQMWLQNPINKFWYSLRKKHDIGSTLVQGSASYVFDMWVKLILEKRRQLTGQFHDEIVLEIKEGFEDKAKELVTSSINKLNEVLGLNRELGISVQFGKRYSEIH